MALSNALAQAGHAPDAVDTRADVDLSMDGSPTISAIRLQAKAKVPGIDDAKFRAIADDAKQNCPVSKALSPVPVPLHSEGRPDGKEIVSPGKSRWSPYRQQNKNN